VLKRLEERGLIRRMPRLHASQGRTSDLIEVLVPSSVQPQGVKAATLPRDGSSPSLLERTFVPLAFFQCRNVNVALRVNTSKGTA
jgi:hypothetical protein